LPVSNSSWKGPYDNSRIRHSDDQSALVSNCPHYMDVGRRWPKKNTCANNNPGTKFPIREEGWVRS
jgi:hypothetical protein